MSKIKSKIYLGVLILMLFGYAFFFSSSCLFSQPEPLRISDYGQTAELADGVSITLRKWVYSPKAATMTVYFTYTSNRLNTNFYVDSQELHTGTEFSMTVNSPAQNEWLVNLLDVPADFKEIRVSVMIAEETENDEQTANTPIAEFYNNQNDVETGEPMAEYTDEEYRIVYLNIERDEKKANIEDIKKRDKQLENDNKKYEETIEKLIKERYYQTTDEIIETNRRVETYQSIIDSNTEQISKDKITIEEITTSITEIDDTIAKLKNKEEKSK